MSNDVPDRRSAFIAIAIFAVIALLIAWDLAVDYAEGVGLGHLAIELLVLAGATGGIGLLWRQLTRTRSNLAEALVEAEQWRRENRELLDGLGAAIENQFEQWRLTRAEADVGLLLLKGLSHREIAEARQTSERTVREQARVLYRKAGLAGRSSLSAFFLEDLLLPHRDGIPAGAQT